MLTDKHTHIHAYIDTYMCVSTEKRRDRDTVRSRRKRRRRRVTNQYSCFLLGL